MKTVYAPDAPTMDTPHDAEARKIHANEHAMVVHLTIQPGRSLRKHITPVDVFFYVLKGTGVVEIGDEAREVSAGTLVDSPARIPHVWRNESDAPVEILVVKTPRLPLAGQSPS